MWKEGAILISGKGYRYWVKHYEEGSLFGIDGGRISKLMIKRGGSTKSFCTGSRRACRLSY